MKHNSPQKIVIATMMGTAIEYFDNYIYAMAAVLVFNHQFFSSTDPLSNQLASLLKKGGYIVFEAFSKQHLAYRTENPKVGGPDKLELLFSIEELKQYFHDFEFLFLEETEVELSEGLFHNGKGKVIRFVAKKQ